VRRLHADDGDDADGTDDVDDADGTDGTDDVDPDEPDPVHDAVGSGALPPDAGPGIGPDGGADGRFGGATRPIARVRAISMTTRSGFSAGVRRYRSA
jgi:hypothetical protein